MLQFDWNVQITVDWCLWW